MRKNATCLSLIVWTLLVSLSFAQEYRKELTQIQHEIDQLQAEMHRLRLKSIGEELQGNQYIHTEWDRYVDQVEKSENTDVDLMKMEKKLEELQKKKREILIQYKLDQGSSDDK